MVPGKTIPKLFPLRGEGWCTQGTRKALRKGLVLAGFGNPNDTLKLAIHKSVNCDPCP